MRTKRKTKLKTDRLEALKQVSQVITATMDPQRIVEVALQAVGELMEGMVVHLWYLQKEERILIPMGSYGLRSAVAENTQSIPVGQGVVGKVAASRGPIAVEDLQVDPHLIPRHLVEQEGLISFLGVPLVWEEKLAGVLSILTRTPHRFNQDEMGLFTSFAQQVAIALENAYRYQDLLRSQTRVAASRGPIAVEDLQVDPHLIPRHLVEQEGLISFLGVPLVWEEKLAGVLSILTRTPHRFNQDEMGLFASFAQQVAIALENAHRYQVPRDEVRVYSEILNGHWRPAAMATLQSPSISRDF